MWCRHCRQDVPGIASRDGVTCVKCGGVSGDSAGAADTPSRDAAFAEASDNGANRNSSADVGRTAALCEGADVSLAEFDFDQDLLAADHAIRKTRAQLGFWEGRDDLSTVGSGRIGESEPSKTGEVAANGPPFASSPCHGRRRRERKGAAPVVAWLSLSLGLMAFVCGAVLVGWSFFAGRGDLWNLGLPLALVGQAGLLIGVIFQMDFLWQSSRATADTLSELDDNLDELRHTTSMLGTTHSSAAQSFYAHMAGGASPEMMLADLKGQLDMLAVNLNRRRAA